MNALYIYDILHNKQKTIDTHKKEHNPIDIINKYKVHVCKIMPFNIHSIVIDRRRVVPQWAFSFLAHIENIGENVHKHVL